MASTLSQAEKDRLNAERMARATSGSAANKAKIAASTRTGTTKAQSDRIKLLGLDKGASILQPTPLQPARETFNAKTGITTRTPVAKPTVQSTIQAPIDPESMAGKRLATGEFERTPGTTKGIRKITTPAIESGKVLTAEEAIKKGRAGAENLGELGQGDFVNEDGSENVQGFINYLQGQLGQATTSRDTAIDVARETTRPDEFTAEQPKSIEEIRADLEDEFFGGAAQTSRDKARDRALEGIDIEIEQARAAQEEFERQSRESAKAQEGALTVSTRGGGFVSNLGVAQAFASGRADDIQRSIERGDASLRQLELQKADIEANFDDATTQAFDSFVSSVRQSYEEDYDRKFDEYKFQKDQDRKDTAEALAKDKFEYTVFKDEQSFLRDLDKDLQGQMKFLYDNYGSMSDGMIAEMGKEVGLDTDSVLRIVDAKNIDDKKAQAEQMFDLIDLPPTQRKMMLEVMDYENVEMINSTLDSIYQESRSRRLKEIREDAFARKTTGSGSSSSKGDLTAKDKKIVEMVRTAQGKSGEVPSNFNDLSPIEQSAILDRDVLEEYTQGVQSGIYPAPSGEDAVQIISNQFQSGIGTQENPQVAQTGATDLDAIKNRLSN